MSERMHEISKFFFFAQPIRSVLRAVEGSVLNSSSIQFEFPIEN